MGWILRWQENPTLCHRPLGDLGSQISLLTWVSERPGTVNKANVSRETGSKDAMGQRDQPAAPFIIPVLVATAEPSVEREPGKQTAGYPQRQGEQHPVTGTERQNESEGLAFGSVSTTQCSISPVTIPALSVQCRFLMVLLAHDNFFLQRNCGSSGKRPTSKKHILENEGRFTMWPPAHRPPPVSPQLWEDTLKAMTL